MPRANLPHLVLREDVARAIGAGLFHLYAVASVSQGIEMLTGVPAGERDASGRFPASSVYGRVERRLIELAERLRQAEAAHAAPRRARRGRGRLDDGSRRRRGLPGTGTR